MSLTNDIGATVDAIAAGSPPADGASSGVPASGSSPKASGDAPASASVASPTSADAPTTAAPEDDDQPDTTGSTFSLEKHRKVLANARAKEAARVREELVKAYGIPPEDFTDLRPHVEALRRDPMAWVKAQAAHLGFFNPTAASEPQPPPSIPEPDRFTEDGAGVYTAQTLYKLLEHRDQQILSQIEKRFAPFEEQTKQAQEAQVKSQATQWATDRLTEAKSWEGFEELRPKIFALMRDDKRFSLEGAYNKVFQADYLPTLKQRNRDAVLAELKTAKPRADLPPSTTPRSSPKASKPGSLNDAIEAALEASLAKHTA